MEKDRKAEKDERLSEESIMEILVTGFVIIIITFFFIKTMFF
ncbi:MAG TPA: hypothetical protein PLU37_03135 [Chitinophagaceae bacterium]|nr:hypothetical protein [Chitinophagaceae bacterium]